MAQMFGVVGWVLHYCLQLLRSVCGRSATVDNGAFWVLLFTFWPDYYASYMLEAKLDDVLEYQALVQPPVKRRPLPCTPCRAGIRPMRHPLLHGTPRMTQPTLYCSFFFYGLRLTRVTQAPESQGMSTNPCSLWLWGLLRTHAMHNAKPWRITS